MARRQYPFHLIEPKWQRHWDETQSFRAWNPAEEIPASHPFAQRHGLSGSGNATKLPPKYYILDMFPYPSGAGLHVGHPEGYTATDILARWRRNLGFNVLHPIGWDAFGLPAEQYAIKTGQHPRITTEQNITTFKRQIKSLGFSYDWSREVDTTDPDYFRWTQWIFLQLYNSWFNPQTNKAEPIETSEYPKELQHSTGEPPEDLESKRRAYRDSKRLAYVTEAPVWWCEELGTVLANEEVVDGKSELGGHPVIRRPMRQWMLRITAYAQRLLDDLNTIEWSDSLKEMQRNWIGRSEGAEVDFRIAERGARKAESTERIRVFTTRPDTLFGATYMVLAPEHPLVDSIPPAAWPDGTPEDWKGQDRSALHNPKSAITAYRAYAAARSDLERTELAKEKTGVFTGAYATNPVNGEKIPIWIADYVLISYGTGAIMAVPAHDARDFEFATKFHLPIREVVAAVCDRRSNEESTGGHRPPLQEAFVGDGTSVNSTGPDVSITDLPTPEAKNKITGWLEEKGLGKGTINYKLRDWLFSRQRYWGEPFPVVWKDGAHKALPETELPLLPPALDDYKPMPDGQPPLARARDWVNLPDGSQRELNTMPQWAGSCWYYLRYLDAKNGNALCSRDAENYWMGSGVASLHRSSVTAKTDSTTPGVDLYVGGTEHAVLHLLYARFWHKVLFDLGHVSTPEPFFKLVNQGLILGEDGQKMSKSRGNVVNPDDVMKEYGADAFRLYEMFMGPLEMVKPWSTKGVEGVYRFLGRVWRLFVDEASETEFEQAVTTAPADQQETLLNQIRLSSTIQDAEPSPGQLKVLHACIKKVTEDLEGLRFNTAISAMMVCINEAMTWPARPVAVLRDFLVLLQPFAPHIAEELWAKLHSAVQTSQIALSYTPWPKWDPKFLVEDTIEIPVQVNGKLRQVIQVPANISREDLEEVAAQAEKVRPFLDGKTVRKVIVVPGKLVNLVVS